MKQAKFIINLALMFLLVATLAAADEGTWLKADQIKPGDWLLNSNGQWVQVQAVRYKQLDEPVSVYNLEVEGSHTYFVGQSGILVHNKGGDDGAKKLLELFEKGASYDEVVKELRKVKGVYRPPIDAAVDYQHLPIVQIRLDKLYGHATDDVKGILKGASHQDGLNPIEVIRVGDKYMINDGVGRATRAIWKGETTINAKIIDSYKSVQTLEKSTDHWGKTNLHWWRNIVKHIDHDETIKKLRKAIDENAGKGSKVADEVVPPLSKTLKKFEEQLAKDKAGIRKELDEISKKLVKKKGVGFTASQQDAISESIARFHPKLREKILAEIGNANPRILKEAADYFKGSRIRYLDYIVLERFTGRNTDLMEELASRGIRYKSKNDFFGILDEKFSFRGTKLYPRDVFHKGIDAKGEIDDLARSIVDTDKFAYVHASKSIKEAKYYGPRVYFIYSKRAIDVNDELLRQGKKNAHPEEDIVAFYKTVYPDAVLGYKDYSDKGVPLIENVRPEPQRLIGKFNWGVSDSLHHANSKYSKSWADKAKEVVEEQYRKLKEAEDEFNRGI